MEHWEHRACSTLLPCTVTNLRRAAPRLHLPAGYPDRKASHPRQRGLVHIHKQRGAALRLRHTASLITTTTATPQAAFTSHHITNTGTHILGRTGLGFFPCLAGRDTRKAMKQRAQQPTAAYARPLGAHRQGHPKSASEHLERGGRCIVRGHHRRTAPCKGLIW